MTTGTKRAQPRDDRILSTSAEYQVFRNQDAIPLGDANNYTNQRLREKLQLPKFHPSPDATSQPSNADAFIATNRFLR